MMWVQRAAERYRGGDGVGIDTRHAFSFSGFYDPRNVRFGALTACNEERLAPGAGFDEHPHRDVEIVTWVLEGELTHRDSAGGRRRVRPGEIQHLSAGSGIRHSERNEGAVPLRFLQMWLTPTEWRLPPEYQVWPAPTAGEPYHLPRASAVLRPCRLAAGRSATLPSAPWCYAHVLRGVVTAHDQRLGPGDAARLTAAPPFEVCAVEAAELLVWEMHAEPRYG